MSRCFPYSPTGYLLMRDNSDALIESIKLQRATIDKAKADRKAERKREKKEKKEKKHHDKKRKRTDEEDCKSDKELAYLKFKALQSGGDEEQRSGVTEEHEQPACSQRPSYSSDSTQNSNKRRRPTMPEYGISTSGSTIKIRLSSLKRIEADPVVVKEKPLRTIVNTLNPVVVKESPLTTTVNTVSALKQKESDPVFVKERPLTTTLNSVSALKQKEFDHVVCKERPFTTSVTNLALKLDSDALLPKEHTLTTIRSMDARPDKEQGCSTSGISRDCTQLNNEKLGIASLVPRVSKKANKVLTLYKELFENWVAPSLQMDVEDQDWLFQGKHQKQERSVVVDSGAAVCSRSSSLWPCAQFLPDVDVYALPFTVPY